MSDILNSEDWTLSVKICQNSLFRPSKTFPSVGKPTKVSKLDPSQNAPILMQTDVCDKQTVCGNLKDTSEGDDSQSTKINLLTCGYSEKMTCIPNTFHKSVKLSS